MSRVITTADRASFKRCRRQWDFRGRTRQNLEPLQPPAIPDLDRAVRLDPASPVVGLVTAAGEAIRYTGRIDLLAVDRSDAYWIVRHRVVEGNWQPTGQLLDDEETLTACWAWEQFYLGMAITGVIYNELQSWAQAPAGAAADQPTAPAEGAADQARQSPRRWRRLWSRPAAAQPGVRQQRPPDRPEEGRLGGGAWGMGRGAAPPKFRTDHSGLSR
jgi:hypothetical protein